MKWSLGRNLIRSLAVHAALLALAWLIFRQQDEPSPVRELKPFSIEIEKGPPRNSHAQSQGGGSRPRHRKLPSLKDLGVFGEKFGAKHGSTLGAPSTGSSQGSPSPYDFENQVTTRTSPILVHLFHRIDGGIAYPPELRTAHISGEVTAKLDFDEHGHWIDSVSSIKGTSNYLRVYVIHQLRRIFAENVPENIWKSEPHAISIEARFIFDIRTPESVPGAQKGPQYAPSVDPRKFSTTDTDGGQSVERQLISTQQGMYGRKFSFYRVHLSSPLDWKFGPFTGYGIMPAVGVDPGWIAEKIDKLIHPKAEIDPLDRYRDDPDW
jgi:hypothetical protein